MHVYVTLILIYDKGLNFKLKNFKKWMWETLKDTKAILELHVKQRITIYIIIWNDIHM